MDQTSETEKTYQKNKYNEIIEILLTAGYFRARINTLSEFDKVVGGLCWCITSSGESVDVDILFQENSTIGQKIALSEAIVVALRKMGCPIPLQPHQIQGGVGGSDYPVIHQAIIWLVKKYFERRVEREQVLRTYSIYQFSKNYTLPEDKRSTDVSPMLQKILDHDIPSRLYKRKTAKNESEETKVRSCLLEFGESFAKLGGQQEAGEAGKPVTSTKGSAPTSMASAIAEKIAEKRNKAAAAGQKGETGDKLLMHVPVVDAVEMALADLSKLDISELSGFEKQLARAAKEAKRDEMLLAEKASKEENEIMKDMHELDENAAAIISGSQVGNIVGLGADEISSASAAYQAELQESKKQLDMSVATGKLGAAAAFTRQIMSLTKEKDELVLKEQEVKIRVDALEEKHRLLTEEQESADEYIDQLRSQAKKLAEIEKSTTQQKELSLIKELIALNESLKLKEADFKTNCKQKRQEFLEEIKKLEQEENDENPEIKQQKEIEEMHSKVLTKYNRLKQMLAETNLEVASTIRVIDDTPTRTELIQYEKRFVELYQQVAWKLDETKKYYDLYNTLDTSLGFIQKEIKLLNSISENFNAAMRSVQAKAEFSKQFETIVKGVEESVKRQENVYVQKQQRLEQLKQVYQKLVEEQRRYYKAVKDFQDECNKNEWLASKLDELQQPK